MDPQIDPNQLITPDDFKNHWNPEIENQNYHSDKTSVSSTSLKSIIQFSPKTFFHTFFVSDSKIESKAMHLGNLAHMAILEGSKFKERYVVEPIFEGFTQKGERTTNPACKDVKEKKAEWIKNLPVGAIVTTAAEKEKLLGMIDSLLSHRKASEFLSNGESETSGFYRDPKTGIKCRIRPDFMCRQRRIITDLKTTYDVREEVFKWKIFGEGKESLYYDLSLAMYCEGFKEIEGHPVELAAWVAICTQPPYEVAVHPMTLPVHELGLIKYRKALTKLKESIDCGVWHGIQKDDEVSFIFPPDYLMDQYGLECEFQVF
jgi:hypothetical protein